LHKPMQLLLCPGSHVLLLLGCSCANRQRGDHRHGHEHLRRERKVHCLAPRQHQHGGPRQRTVNGHRPRTRRASPRSSPRSSCHRCGRGSKSSPSSSCHRCGRGSRSSPRSSCHRCGRGSSSSRLLRRLSLLLASLSFARLWFGRQVEPVLRWLQRRTGRPQEGCGDRRGALCSRLHRSCFPSHRLLSSRLLTSLRGPLPWRRHKTRDACRGWGRLWAALLALLGPGFLGHRELLLHLLLPLALLRCGHTRGYRGWGLDVRAHPGPIRRGRAALVTSCATLKA
jgi:hypothetical protein